MKMNVDYVAELQSGTTLNNGKYTIEKKIGQGGFGITYKAVQNSLDRAVCIKEYFISGFCVRDTQSKTIHIQGMTEEVYEKHRTSFVREAKTLATLHHQGVVEVMDVFDENGTSYMVMPFIEGQSLQSIVENNGPLSYPEAVNYIAQVANAVDYIHQRHILHRDIKPDNIMITADYKAILIDFGSAREFEQDKTQSHTSMITKGYAPIEQYDRVSRKGSYTDIYSIGATLYFILTGQMPMEPTARMMERMPEPKELNPSIPNEANRTIMKAMELKPQDRHQTMQEFMEDLRNEKQPEQDSVIEYDSEPLPITPQNLSNTNKTRTAPIVSPSASTQSLKDNQSKPNKTKIALMVAGVAAIIGLIVFLVKPKESSHDESTSNVKATMTNGRDVRFTCNVADAVLYVDGTSLGNATGTYLLKDGQHSVKATAGGYKDFNGSFAVGDGREYFSINMASLLKDRETITVNGVSFTMIKVEAGTFTMGCTSEQDGDCDSDESPYHRVTISSDYYIGKYEVTQELWQEVMGNNPSNFKGFDRPVEMVSWNDCVEFCNELSRMTGRRFRLPTEAEWEYAARGGRKSTNAKYSGSSSVANVAWYTDNSGGQTHPVGKLRANELGIHDMSGNVWEWCSDWYGNYSSASQTDPYGPGSGQSRVLRGGGWGGLAWCCRVSYRSNNAPGNRNGNFGFRVVFVP